MANTDNNILTQRENTINVGLHILEHSNAPRIDKIKASLIGLCDDDLKTCEKALIQTLTTLNQKI
jgi:hypothetical protein